MKKYEKIYDRIAGFRFFSRWQGSLVKGYEWLYLPAWIIWMQFLYFIYNLGNGD